MTEKTIEEMAEKYASARYMKYSAEDQEDSPRCRAKPVTNSEWQCCKQNFIEIAGMILNLLAKGEAGHPPRLEVETHPTSNGHYRAFRIIYPIQFGIEYLSLSEHLSARANDAKELKDERNRSEVWKQRCEMREKELSTERERTQKILEIIDRSGIEGIYNWGAPLREIRSLLDGILGSAASTGNESLAQSGSVVEKCPKGDPL